MPQRGAFMISNLFGLVINSVGAPREGYTSMLVIGVSHPGGRSRTLETRLIEAGMRIDNPRQVCDNIAPDARGQSKLRPNFIYVVFR